MNKRLIAILTSLSISPVILPAPAFGNLMLGYGQSMRAQKNAEQESCGMSQPTQRVEVKHIEGKGVGYKKGYSSLEGFFTIPSTLDGSWVPFLDLRGHIFNDGKSAATGGLGLRYLADSRVWGANVYYDYRETHRRHYNQVGAGLESLGKVWDFRVNAYIPVGAKHSHLTHTHFHEFKHNSIILTSKKEIAMKGGNAEVGAHALRQENYQLYAAAGPYYFEREAKVAWGGEGRLVFTAFDYLRLQLSGSYDKVFKGIVQGEVALTYSFGGKRTIKACNCNDCHERKMIDRRALQRVDRNEIIVVDKKRQKTKAKNPVTGDPYVVWFVNNTSHSLGTFESPFNTLVDAQNASGPNDLIYVYVGDGTDNGMNMGIALKQGQQLLGAGIGQQILTTRGAMTIPAHDTGLPKVSNTLSPLPIQKAAVVLNAGNNVVSGFNFVDTIGGGPGVIPGDKSSCILIQGGLNYLIQNNMAFTSNKNGHAGLGGNCINLWGGGNVVVANNIFLAGDNGFGTSSAAGVSMYPIISALQGAFLFENNLFTGSSANAGFYDMLDLEPTIPGTPGAFSLSTKGLIGNIAISIVNNTSTSLANTVAASGGIFLFTGPAIANPMSVNITGNNIPIPAGYTKPGGGINIFQANAGVLNVNIANNQVPVSPTLSTTTATKGISIDAKGPVNSFFTGNTVTIPSTAVIGAAGDGFHVFAHVANTNATFSNNVATTPPAIPGFRFKYDGNSTFLNVNFGNGNIGTVTMGP